LHIRLKYNCNEAGWLQATKVVNAAVYCTMYY